MSAASLPRAVVPGAGGRLLRWVGDDTALKRLLTARSWMIRAYFEARYLVPDPWRLATSEYERARAERTLAALGRRRYGTALEVGCGEGLFTSRLLALCDRIVAVDFSGLALRRARRRHAGDPRVRVRRLDVLHEDPDGAFDLVVCAELFYYMNRAQFESLAPRVARWVAPGGDLCLVHGTSVHDAAGLSEARGGGTGARALHDRFRRIPGLVVLRERRYPRYLITVLRREPPCG